MERSRTTVYGTVPAGGWEGEEEGVKGESHDRKEYLNTVQRHWSYIAHCTPHSLSFSMNFSFSSAGTLADEWV